MEEIYVEIPNELSDYVERLFFEHEQGLRILAYLTARPETLKEHLDAYLHEVEQKGVELELAKTQAKNMYAPCDACNVECFCFDFENSRMKFKVKSE